MNSRRFAWHTCAVLAILCIIFKENPDPFIAAMLVLTGVHDLFEKDKP